MDLFKSKIFPLLARARKALENILSFLGGVFSFRRARKEKVLAGEEADKKLVYSLSRSKIPSFSQIRHLGRTLDSKESGLLKFFSLLIFLSVIFLGFNFGRQHILFRPVFGGEYSEGLIGSPARVNPLYFSANDADADIGRLVFSSLFKRGKNGEPEKDLAADYKVSEDGKIYTVKLRGDARWHDGSKVTADDVLFTFQAIKDPAYASPLRANFSGVEAEEGAEEGEINFILSEKYAPFIGLLTFGILPSEIWSRIAPEAAALADLNLKPIGSGPYEFKTLFKDKSGNIKSYVLAANKNYYGGSPLIKEIAFKFYPGFFEAISALNANEVDGLSYLPKEEKSALVAKNSLYLHKLNLPQIKAVFFNSEKNSVLKDVKVRQALSFASPREAIISDVLGGEGAPAYGPIPAGNFAFNGETEKYNFNLDRAAALLAEAGWKKEKVEEAQIAALKERQEKPTSTAAALNSEEKELLARGAGEWLVKEELISKNKKETKKTYLTVILTAADDEENSKIAKILKTNWEKLGVKIDLQLMPAADIQAKAIKPRAYEALLFSQFVGADPDVYVFWHSSQSGENGLNLSNYKNEEADKMLEEGRLSLNREERIGEYKKFQEILAREAPAIFLYSPYYTYVQSKKIKNFNLKEISSPADRFIDASEWHIKTGRRIIW